MQGSVEDNCKFREIGSLAWFCPAVRASHACDTQGFVTRIDSSEILFNNLWEVSSRFNNRRIVDLFCHKDVLPLKSSFVPVERCCSVPGAQCTPYGIAGTLILGSWYL